MVCTLYVVGTLGVVGLAMLIRAAVTAPQGVEDEHGFHLTEAGKPSAAKETLLSTSDLSFFTH